MSKKNTISSFLLPFAAAILVAGFAPAQEKGKDASKPDKNTKGVDKVENKPQPKNNNPARKDGNAYDKLRMGPNGLPMPADRTASIEAKRVLDEAKAGLGQAISGSAGTSNAAIENELWKQDDYRQASLDLRRAQADYDAVRRPIFDALRADAFYKELDKKQRERQRVISNLVMTGRGSFDWLFPHAMEALEVRSRMTREEIMAMAQAPEVEEARQRMLDQAAKVRAIRANSVAQMTNSEDARAARDELDSARDTVKAAQRAYNVALAEEAEYERIRQAYLEEVRRTGKAPAAGN
jgi:hypothetical protein